MTCVRRRYDVQKNGGRSPIENKQLPFLHSDNRNYFTWVFIKMCTIVTSSDMTSFVYIDDEKHHQSKWLGKEKK